MQEVLVPRKQSYFAARLKELRTEAGLSQRGLAEQSGVPIGTIRYFEYSLREPTYETLVKLAAGLGVSLSAFDPPAKPRRRKEARDE
jgi:transcriptional regulator with XRE-family HTH domain